MRILLILVDVVAFVICCSGLVQINARAGLPLELGSTNDTVYCTRVADESLASTIYPGDRILKINGQAITQTDEFEFQLDACHIGDSVAVMLAGVKGIHRVTVRAEHYYRVFYLITVILVSALFMGVGLVVLWKKPKEPVALVYHLGSLATAMQLSTTWGAYQTAPVIIGPMLRAVFATTYAFIPVLFFHLMCLFPGSRRSTVQKAIPFLYGAAAILAAGAAISFYRAWAAGSVIGFRGHLQWFSITRIFLIVLVFGGLWRFRQSYFVAVDESERKKLRWVLWGMFVGLLPFVVLWIIPNMILGYGLVPESVMLLASGFIPLAFGISILKYHIMDINLLLNRSLVYGTVMVMVVVVYMIVVGGLAMVVTNATYELSLGLSMAAAIAVALLFEPTRRVVQGAVDRKYFRVQYDFRQAARKFQEDVKTCVTIEDLGRLVVSRIDALIPVERIAFLLADESSGPRVLGGRATGIDTAAISVLASISGGLPIAAEGATEPGVPLSDADPSVLDQSRISLVCPVLRSDSRLLGMLVLGPKKAGTRFVSEDVDLLRNLALQGGAEIERILLQHAVMEQNHETDRLQRLNAVKSDFVSYVSHELRTPLTSIRMFAELLIGHIPRGDARAREYTAIIGGEASRLQRMVDTILDSAKIDQGEQHYTLHPVRLDLLLHDVLRTMKYQVAKEKFKVALEISNGIRKNLRDAFLVDADADAVQEALINLLTNAMKYSGESKRIRIGLRRSLGGIACSVQDYGRGIPAETMPHLFEKFYRDPSLPRRIQGVGLGLSVVKHIMEAHGGRISVQSAPDKGSTFTLEFPCHETGKGTSRSKIHRRGSEKQ
jgi:signal transduction histidine kinase